MDVSDLGHSATENAMEHVSDSGLADASISRCSSPDTVVGDDNNESLILTPTSSICSTTAVTEAEKFGSNNDATTEGAADTVNSDPGATSSGTPHHRAFEEVGNNNCTSHDQTLDNADSQPESAQRPAMRDSDERFKARDSSRSYITQLPSGSYTFHNNGGGGGTTFTHSGGTFTFRTSGSRSTFTTFTSPSHSFNISSSTSNARASKTSARHRAKNTYTNETLSALRFEPGTEITNCKLTNCSGRKLEITNCRLTNCSGRNLEVTNCSCSGCEFADSEVTNCRLAGRSKVSNSELTNCVLADCEVVGGSRTNCSYS